MAPREKQARVQLRDLMSRISEDELCAGWMDGIEYELWKRVMNKTDITKDTARLRELSESAGGWWHWPDDSDGPLFVTHEKVSLVLGK